LETRGLSKEELALVAQDSYSSESRNLTEHLNNWASIKELFEPGF
jgi:hypothetical protein